MMKKKVFAIAGIAAAAALVLAGCSSGDKFGGGDGKSKSSGGTVTVGSANFPESQLLATIYADALTDKGVKVQKKLNIGAREVYIPALQDGSIDLIPEYNGALLRYFDKGSDASTADAVDQALAAKLPKTLKLLETSKAEDNDALVVTKETADKYHLSSISDLKAVQGDLTLAASQEWPARESGAVGLKKIYGVEMKTIQTDAGGPVTLNALTTGQAQVADLFTTDPAITKNKLVTLKDDKNLFPAQNVVPVINKDKATSKVSDALGAVSKRLTTDDLRDMLVKVSGGSSMDDVANEWLKSHDLS